MRKSWWSGYAGFLFIVVCRNECGKVVGMDRLGFFFIPDHVVCRNECGKVGGVDTPDFFLL